MPNCRGVAIEGLDGLIASGLLAINVVDRPAGLGDQRGGWRREVAEQVQLGHRRPRPTVYFGKRAQSHIARGHGCKAHRLLAGVVRERAGRYRAAPRRAVGADVELVPADATVHPAVLARQVAEAGQGVTRAEVDLDLVGEGRCWRGVIFRMPKRGDIPVESFGSLIAWGLLAIDCV